MICLLIVHSYHKLALHLLWPVLKDYVRHCVWDEFQAVDSVACISTLVWQNSSDTRDSKRFISLTLMHGYWYSCNILFPCSDGFQMGTDDKTSLFSYRSTLTNCSTGITWNIWDIIWIINDTMVNCTVLSNICLNAALKSISLTKWFIQFAWQANNRCADDDWIQEMMYVHTHAFIAWGIREWK